MSRNTLSPYQRLFLGVSKGERGPSLPGFFDIVRPHIPEDVGRVMSRGGVVARSASLFTPLGKEKVTAVMAMFLGSSPTDLLQEIDPSGKGISGLSETRSVWPAASAEARSIGHSTITRIERIERWARKCPPDCSQVPKVYGKPTRDRTRRPGQGAL